MQLSEEFEKAEELATNDKKVIIVIDKIHLATETTLDYSILDLLEKLKDNKNIFIILETNEINRLSKDFKFRFSNKIEFSKPEKNYHYHLRKNYTFITLL